MNNNLYDIYENNRLIAKNNYENNIQYITGISVLDINDNNKFDNINNNNILNFIKKINKENNNYLKDIILKDIK